MKAPSTKRIFVPLAALAAALAIAVAPAVGADPTRDDYAAKAEPICKANTQANTKILKGARANVTKKRFAIAAGQFSRAAGALERTAKQLKRIAQPPADTATLARWLGQVNSQVAQLRKISKALRAKNRFKAQSLVVRLTQNANQANALVANFGFNYCKFRPSRFT